MEVKPIKTFALGDGLEVWFVNVSDLKEQSVNARVMTSEAFNQLSDNIKRDNRLESLPLCAYVDGELEIVSGHHRVRAAKKAGILEVWVLVDVTGMSRDRIRSKQLSHNSLQGMDDKEIVAAIFSEIVDGDARIAAFVDGEEPFSKDSVTLTTSELEVEFKTRVASIAFLPVQMVEFKHALELLTNLEPDEAYLAGLDEYDTLLAAVGETEKTFDIHSVPTIFAKMAQIVIAHCKAQTPKE